MKRLAVSFFLITLVIPFCFAQRELVHAYPSKLGFDEDFIKQKVDSIMEMGIDSLAFPGAQLLVAKNDTVIFHKAYGFHTYDSIQPVALNDMYDLASVTKISGPLPALMKLVDEGKLDLDQSFSTYWEPWKRRKDKKELTLREILAHQAGLVPYIVFLQKVLRKMARSKGGLSTIHRIKNFKDRYTTGSTSTIVLNEK